MRSKSILKKRTPTEWSIVISVGLLLPFTFFVQGPLQLYLTNINEFWFSIKDVLLVSMIPAIILFIILLSIVLLLHEKPRAIALALLFGIGFAFYIQGNFLLSDYGILDGQAINWSIYKNQAVFNSFVWLACLLIPFFLIRLLKQKAFKIFAAVSGIFICMQIVSLTTLLVTTPFKTDNDRYYLSNDGMFEVSAEQNVIVFLLDAFDAEYMDHILKDSPEFFEPLDGFTYFHNCVGSYSTTKGALPFILTGQHYTNDISYSAYLKDAWSDNPFYKTLLKKNYNIGVYTHSQFVTAGLSDTLVNYNEDEFQMTSYSKFGELMYQLVSFRYMPHMLKPLFTLYSGDFDALQAVKSNVAPYKMDDVLFYKMLLENGLSVTKKINSFRFYHMYGSHPPYTMNSKGEKVEENSVDLYKQTKGALNIVYDYIVRMKAAGIYNDATIIIMADHGAVSNPPSLPVLLVKRPGNTTGFSISEAPVSHDDLQATIIQGISGDSMPFGRSVFDVAEGEDRNRTFYFYKWDSQWNMDYLPEIREYLATGNSNKEVSFALTGKIYRKGETVKYVPPQFVIGETSSISGKEDCASRYFVYGLSYVQESRYAWTIGSQSEIRMKFNETPANDLKLQFHFLSVFNSQQRLIVTSGDSVLFNDIVTSGQQSVSINVPKKLVVDQELTLDLKLPDAVSPESISGDQDLRKLAFGFTALTVEYLHPIPLNTSIAFTQQEQADQLFVYGLFPPESGYAWTNGKKGKMNLMFSEQSERDMIMTWEVQRVFNDSQRLIVRCGGSTLYDQQVISGTKELSIVIPQSSLVNRSLMLELEYPDAISPQTLLQSDDPRELAFALTCIRFNCEGETVKYTPPQFVVGETSSISDKENCASRYFTHGLSYVQESRYAWTNGSQSEIRMRLDEVPTNDLKLQLHLSSVFNNQQRLIVTSGDSVLFNDIVTSGQQSVSINVSKELVVDQELTLGLEFPDAVSPESISANQDSRKLAFGITALTVEYLHTLP